MSTSRSSGEGGARAVDARGEDADAAREAAKAAEAEAAAVRASTPPPPPTGPAMTLEQYRYYVASQAHARGTVHATPAEEKAEAEEKKRHGWWACQSYKCSGKTLNPKAVERCDACGALRRLDSGSTFNSGATESQLRFMRDVARR